VREPVSSLPRAQEERNLDPCFPLVERGRVLDGAGEKSDPPRRATAPSEGDDELFDEVGSVHVDGERLHGIDYRQPAPVTYEPIG
jgi:hypothetical protein